MKKISRSALQPYSAQQMFELVNDVARYPDFLPWCSKGEVLEHDGNEMVAAVHISKGPVQQAFTTRNRIVPYEQIDMTLVDGPFKHLQGQWRFTPLADNACKVEFDIEYEVAGGLFGKLLAPVFEQIATTLVEAFCQRARSEYGKPAA